MSNDTPARKQTLLAVLLALTTLSAYWSVTQHGFVIYDDPEYVTQNRMVQGGLTWDGFVWAFGSTHLSNWHPLTWLSHMLDCQLFGLNAGMHHLVNLLLHVANTLLLFHVLRRMTGAVWRSGFVAAMFAWHPLHVESVAWVAERKDVLSALFWMLTLLAYLRYVERPGVGRYLITLLCFALGLMAKPMVVTLPLVFLLMDWWPLQRFRLRDSPGNVTLIATEAASFTRKTLASLCVEKIPFLAWAAVSSAITMWSQQAGQSVVPIVKIGAGFRIANALIAYLDYSLKTIWPTRLVVFYPLPDSHPAWKVLAAVVVVGLITALALRTARSRSYILAGWLWYLGTLVPVIGLVQVGDQALADRYTYIPLVGLGIVIAWGAADLVARWRTLRLPMQITGAMALACWIVVTGNQLSYWKDNYELFAHALAVTGRNHVAETVLGNILVAEGKTEEAKRLFARALEARPTYHEAHFGMGNACAAEGKLDQAIALYREALRLNPKLVDAHNAMGAVFMQQNKPQEALTHFAEALKIDPQFVEAQFNWALAMHLQGRLDEAVAGYARVLQLRPNSREALLSLGNALVAQRKFAEALPYYQQLLRVEPGSVDALNRIAWVLATHEDEKIRDGREAVRLATRACELTAYQSAQSLNSLAAAYAETGRFGEAAQTAEKAVASARASGQKDVAEISQKLLQLYKAGVPYRDTAN